MIHTYIKDRYASSQSILKHIGDDGCFFLSLLTIAEEYLKERGKWSQPFDIINTYKTCLSKRWMAKDCYINSDGTPLLKYLTGVGWLREERESIGTLSDREYSIAIYYNERTGHKHFRRRYVDTLENSVTVKEGKIIKYYVYKALS